jgi:hypothetical protein
MIDEFLLRWLRSAFSPKLKYTNTIFGLAKRMVLAGPKAAETAESCMILSDYLIPHIIIRITIGCG